MNCEHCTAPAVGTIEQCDYEDCGACPHVRVCAACLETFEHRGSFRPLPLA